MKRRLYFLLPGVKLARQVFRELLLARVEERHIHFMAREGTRLTGLPEATILQKSDAIHGVETGLIVGWAAGAFAGTVAVLFPPAGFSFDLGIILATSLLGAIMGIWVSGMIAADVPNSRLVAFQREMESGRIFMIVDVPKRRVAEISAMVKRHHPQADMRGLEPRMPAFP